MATNLSKLIALDTGIFMAGGDINAAVKQGLTNMGLNSSEPYSFVETDTYQLITHEGMPSSQALSCNQCHGSTATQMNLKDMGYVLKGAASSLCAQCHEYKSSPGFTSLHKKHVSEKKVDCSKCHNFTRASAPTPAPSPTSYTLSVTKSGTGSGTVNSSPAGISCGSDCSQSYPANTQVTLAATASSGSTFAGWSGNSDCSDGAVTVNAAKSCTATFNVQQSSSGPDISAPSSFSFGSVNVNSSTTRSISVQNKGTATLRVSRVTVSGANASMFRPLSTYFSVSRSGSYSLRVRFSPRSSGSKTATLTIYSNDPDTPVKSIALSGSGGSSSNDDD
jgi:cytochrome c553